MVKISKETKKKWLNLKEIPFIVGLNRALIRRRNLLQEDVGKIFGLHGEKVYLYNDARLFLFEIIDNGGIDDSLQSAINDFNEILENLEFQAQRAWGFDEDSNFHNWWLDMPGCTCPKLDNAERYGNDRILSGSCPWHGNFDNTRKTI